MDKTYDFSGWATRNDLKCTDGRVIRRDAFKHCDGVTVPLLWNHDHDNMFNVLGHAVLENREDGVYAYGYLNDSEQGNMAREYIKHGDVNALSIWANKLKQKGSDVLHGTIKEVSLVYAGANPGAYIDTVSIAHGDDGDLEEAIIYTGLSFESDLMHSDNEAQDAEDEIIEEIQHSDEEEKTVEDSKTVQDVIDSMNEEQKNVLYALVGQALEDNNSEGDEDMKHNVFEADNQEDVLIHSEGMETILKDGKRFGSLKESFLAHADEYGIKEIEALFPEATNLNSTPEFIKRDTGWVSVVMNGVHKSPFSRIKSQFADIREDEARAKGYIKGNLKKDEVFSLLKRTTTPTTIYKKQKLDRDDILDITDFDVVAWIKQEMRIMLDEEIARAILIGDGRLASDDDKINEQNIRPIAKEAALYTIQSKVNVAKNATSDEKAKAFIRQVIKSRKDYKGSGEPTLFTTEDVITDCLLLEDQIGHPLYDTMEKLRTKLRVKEIVTVEVMEGEKGIDGGDLMGILVNLKDYNVGADKGGSINMFEDFDIDYNQEKYLMETRCSGALTKPFSAIAFELKEAE